MLIWAAHDMSATLCSSHERRGLQGARDHSQLPGKHSGMQPRHAALRHRSGQRPEVACGETPYQVWDVATCTLWTRIKTLIDELRELLFYCNDVAGDPTLPESTRRLSTPARLQEQLHTHGHPDSGTRLSIHGCGVV